jgi:hypothetical protein
MTGLRSRPHGAATLRADSLAVGGVHLATAIGLRTATTARSGVFR